MYRSQLPEKEAEREDREPEVAGGNGGRRPEATSARARRLASPAPARPARSPRLLRGYGAAHPARFGPGLPCPRLRRGSAFAAPPLLREPPEGPRPLESTRLTRFMGPAKTFRA